MVIEELFTRLGFEVDPKGLDKAKNQLSSLKKWIGGLALGAGFIGLAKTGLDAAMTMEGLNAQFTVMTGSAEKAKNVIDEIASFAAKTPFDKLGLSGAATTLMAFGMESEQVVPTLKMLGDVAGADQNKLNSLALVFGQIQSAGKLAGGDLLQLINLGFNPLTIISQKTGIAVADLKDQMSKGAITADMVTLAFKAATSEGGLFFGNLEAQSQTFAGKMSTLKDNFVTALQKMAEAFLPMLKAGADMLIAFDWTPIVDSVREFAIMISAIPFDVVFAWIRRLSLVVIAFATRDLQVTLITALKKVAITGSNAFTGLTLSFASFKTGIISGAKAIGTAMKTALGPIGIALMAIEGFVTAYNWLQDKAQHQATEKEKESARNFFKSRFVFNGKQTREQVLDELEKELGKRKEEVQSLQAKASAGGAEGRAASKRIQELTPNIRDREKLLSTLKTVYAEDSGVEWKSPGAGMVTDPKLGNGLGDLEKKFSELTKELKDNTKATKKNTKAKEKPPFDISALSRQAFDAAFNVKLRELTLGAI